MGPHTPIRLLIVDDHQIVIDGIKALLRKAQHIEIVGEANDGIEALNLLDEKSVDLLITDIQMPRMDGLALTKKLKDEKPEVKILVLSMYKEPQVANEIFMCGAEGFILKNTGKKELLQAIEKIIGGGTFYSREILQLLMQRHAPQPKQTPKGAARLSPREQEILQLIAQENSTNEIASILSVSPRTVETHRKHMLQKTESRSVVGLMRYAFEHQLV
ncbi:MAG: response regulator transcription factor [Bacteroidota bacterium]